MVINFSADYSMLEIYNLIICVKMNYFYKWVCIRFEGETVFRVSSKTPYVKLKAVIVLKLIVRCSDTFVVNSV